MHQRHSRVLNLFYMNNNYQRSIDDYVCKGNTLFSNEEMFGRKIANKTQFDNTLSSCAESIIECIWMGIKRGQDLLSKESSFVVNWRNTKSNTYAPRVYEELSKLFGDRCGWLKGDRFSVDLSGYILLFKMVTEDRANPGNIPTKSTSDIQDQLSSEEGDSPIIHVCYVLDRSKNVLMDVVAKYIKGSETIWSTSLYDLVNSINQTSDQQIITFNSKSESSTSSSNVVVKNRKQKDITNQ